MALAILVIKVKAMALRCFTLEYWIDEGWYVGRLKEVPGVFSQGESLQELEDNIRDAYKLMVDAECEKSQFSLEGLFKGGPPITKEAIDAAIYGTDH
jgi:predicted RNase H-like HicB family nuclease